jgi:hypothetical protein
VDLITWQKPMSNVGKGVVVMKSLMLPVLGILLMLNGCGGKPGIKESDITVLTTDSVPPAYQEMQQNVTDLSTALVREIFRRMQIAPEIQTLPWKEAYEKTLNENKTALYAVIQTGSRRTQFKWVGPLIIDGNTEFYIAFNSNTPDDTISKWSEALNDMKKDGTYRRICTQHKIN